MFKALTAVGFTAGLALAGLLGVASPSGAATAPSGSTLTRVTQVAGHGDSGVTGPLWASENYSLTATVTRADATSYDPAAYCGAASTDTGHCYKWTAAETFGNGTFTTLAGQPSPRTGATLGAAVTGPFAGWVRGIVFYASWKSVYASQARVPASRNDGGTKGSGDYTVSRWPALFFGKTATVNVADFGDGQVSTYWFRYDLPFGANPACPSVAYRWTDSVPWNNDGAKVTSGDILAPTAAGNCT